LLQFELSVIPTPPAAARPDSVIVSGFVGPDPKIRSHTILREHFCTGKKLTVQKWLGYEG